MRLFGIESRCRLEEPPAAESFGEVLFPVDACRRTHRAGKGPSCTRATPAAAMRSFVAPGQAEVKRARAHASFGGRLGQLGSSPCQSLVASSHMASPA